MGQRINPFIFSVSILFGSLCRIEVSGNCFVKRASSYIKLASGDFDFQPQDVITISEGTLIIKTQAGNIIKKTGPLKSEILDLGDETAVIKLDEGRIKSIVKKLSPRSKFEIKTPLAVAAVRGTEFDVGVREGRVEVETIEGVVGVMDNEGRLEVIEAGRGCSIDSAGTRIYKLDRVIPSDIRETISIGMSKQDIIKAAQMELKNAEYLEGKTLIDVNGNRVRLEEYIVRNPKDVAANEAAKSFKLVVLNHRENRLDYFYFLGTFNKELPADLSGALSQISGGVDKPEFYLEKYEKVISNVDDYIKDNASGGHLVKITYNDDGTVTLWEEGGRTLNYNLIIDEGGKLKAYDPVSDAIYEISQSEKNEFLKPAVYNSNTDTYEFSNTVWRTRFDSYKHVINGVEKISYTGSSILSSISSIDSAVAYQKAPIASLTEFPSGEDKLHTAITLYYADGTYEKYNTYIINDEGEIADIKDFLGITAGKGFRQKLLNYNYEQVTEASEFKGRKIDIVVEPKILIKSGLLK